MKEGKASFSAEIIAAMRALESRRPEHLRICYDPYARELIRSRFRFVAQSKLVTKLILRYLEKKAPGLQAGIAARTRYIDDIVKKDVAGAQQVVILGAGLDMRAYRLEELKHIPVFEVDFPATQQLKRSKLKHLKLPQRDKLTYVPIDFNKQRLKDALDAAGYDPTLKTLFLWEGVTMYLDANSIDITLASIREDSPAGSTLFFDYLYKKVLDGLSGLTEAKGVYRSQSFAGRGTERYTFGIAKEDVPEFLKERGFELMEHMSGDSLKERYFHGENAKRYVFRVCGFVHARTID
ncbi:MAG: SAM-dependent methyltransferase [Flavobacteriales bacterium]|nr:SAM-dependent methyltransferase [Flavobacteriales bacterium]